MCPGGIDWRLRLPRNWLKQPSQLLPSSNGFFFLWGDRQSSSQYMTSRITVTDTLIRLIFLISSTDILPEISADTNADVDTVGTALTVRIHTYSYYCSCPRRPRNVRLESRGHDWLRRLCSGTGSGQRPLFAENRNCTRTKRQSSKYQQSLQ